MWYAQPQVAEGPAPRACSEYSMTNHILIVEDEVDLATTVEINLQREGYTTKAVTSGAEALLAAAADPQPSLILLDLMLPDLPGTEVCRRLKENAKTRDIPVILCTARGSEVDRVVGFEIGADDYVVKPFSVRELGLRVRALLRRVHQNEAEGDQIKFGRLRVDKQAHRAWIDDQEIYLTALEFRLLATFISRRGRVQSRDALLSDVWGIEADVTTRTVDTHVKRLREKLGELGDYVETLRGVGYRFRDEP